MSDNQPSAVSFVSSKLAAKIKFDLACSTSSSSKKDMPLMSSILPGILFHPLSLAISNEEIANL